jgi:hypothetical protein
LVNSVGREMGEEKANNDRQGNKCVKHNKKKVRSIFREYGRMHQVVTFSKQALS